MHFSLLAASVALVGFVSAQTADLPDCAKNCVNTLLPASCNLKAECICADTNFIDNISCCIYNACQPSDQQAALDYAKTICTNGQLPASAGCSSTTASSTAASTTTDAAGATGSSISSSIDSSVSSVSASAASAASSSSSAADGQRLAAQGMGLVGAVVGAVALL